MMWTLKSGGSDGPRAPHSEYGNFHRPNRTSIRSVLIATRNAGAIITIVETRTTTSELVKAVPSESVPVVEWLISL